jgi:hypothetical protein
MPPNAPNNTMPPNAPNAVMPRNAQNEERAFRENGVLSKRTDHDTNDLTRKAHLKKAATSKKELPPVGAMMRSLLWIRRIPLSVVPPMV